jgi:DMSO reductase anchor subunit
LWHPRAPAQWRSTILAFALFLCTAMIYACLPFLRECEFFHGRTQFFLRSIKWLFVLGVFVAPILLLSAAMSGVSMTVSLLAFVVQYLGLVAERWFFFAEANHPQNLYYQAIA